MHIERGVGKPISECSTDQEQNGWLCYPKCVQGYHGVGPVCWQDCPAGFYEGGVVCIKPEPYGRGVGYAIWSQEKCERENR